MNLSAESHYQLAYRLSIEGQLDEARAHAEQAIALDPRHAEAHNNLGFIAFNQGSFEEAVEHYREAVSLKPDYTKARYNLGLALAALGRWKDAVPPFQQALARQPDFFEAASELGNAFLNLHQLDDAIASYQRAVALRPQHDRAQFNLGCALLLRNAPDAAVSALNAVIAARPELALARYTLGLAYLAQGRPSEARQCFDQPMTADDIAPGLASNSRLFGMHCIASYHPAEIFAAHRAYGEQFEAPLKASWAPHVNAPDPDRRLKIGYASPDLSNHAVARFLEPILAHHDKGRFDITAYHNSPFADEVTTRLRSYVDQWRACSAWSDEQLAACIREDGIDILIDLAGHTRGHRLLTFARKPAPIQITYLGYPDTTGLTAMDYRLTTLDTDPAGAEAWHTEKLYKLPRTLWCYRSPPEFARLPARHSGPISFGSMNNFAKVSPETVAVWGEILRQVPDSRLILTGVPDGSARTLLLERMAAHGVTPERLLMHGKLPPDRFHATLGEIDIALDPFPYNGTTTTCEALWMGIPVVTLIGQTSVSRSGYALLKTLGLEDLCAQNQARYVGIAVELANDRIRLTELHRTLRRRFEQSPLRDEAGFTREVESAYRTMWRERCSK